MTDLLISLLGGVVLIVILFAGIYRISPLGGKNSAALVALAVLGIYVPLAIVFWPGGDVFAIHLAIYLVTVYVLGIVSSQRDARASTDKQEGWFHWGPAAIIAFFTIVVSVDAIFIVLAQKGLDTQVASVVLPDTTAQGEVSSFFPGTVSHDFRQKEDQYNAYLEQIEQQARQNWKIRKGWVKVPQAGERGTFKVQVTDAQAQALQNATVTGTFMRSANSKLDQAFSMHETTPGVYESGIVLPVPGRWDLVLTIRRGDELHELRASTSVKP